jgi:mono/diheme cytochrome c family protein
MNWLALLLLAQGADESRGAKVFQQSCAVGYCHGSGGSANRAPRLAGKSFERGALKKIVDAGVPGTAMPGFRALLPAADLEAVVEYVMKLGAGAPAASTHAASGGPAPAEPALPAEARRGKDLFFNAVGGTRCSTCHAVDGMGVAIGPNLAASPPQSGAAIANVKPRHVEQADAQGDRFPALLVEKKGGWTKVFDLTVAPPVLRTFADQDIRLTRAEWSHGAAITAYSRVDLEAVAGYLKWLASRAGRN